MRYQKSGYMCQLHVGERGTAAVEFAIIIPIVVVMAIATLDFAQGIYRKMQVQNAAQMGAQYAVARGYDKTSIANVVTSTGFAAVEASPEPSQFCGCATSTGIDVIDCNLKCSGGTAPGTYVRVSAKANYSPLIPYPLVPSSFTFRAQSTVRIQ
jgi:Flp pilus assembly protein TadG